MKKSIENKGITATGALKNEVAGKTKPGIDKVVSKFFNNIIVVCKKYDGYAVTSEEKKIMPKILRKYIQENKPLFGDIFVLSLCRDLGYSDPEIEPLKNMKLWKELCEIGKP